MAQPPCAFYSSATMKPLKDIAADLAAGRTTSRALTEVALSRIADPAGEGMVAFTVVYEDSAMQAATLSDER
ncbi:MAG: hypothetical protein OQJ76_03615, partial [Rhodospirillales bacterium]|nr:hypothetical protein [Rhodospirillales bacterium]